MKSKIFFPVFIFLFVATSTRAEFRAGIAVRVVTPDPLLPVSGGVGPSSPVNKQEGDLTVRALVFADDTTKVAIVTNGQVSGSEIQNALGSGVVDVQRSE